MPMVFCGLSPHPPILVPEIGGSEIKKCADSREGLQVFSRELASARADSLILITPHGPAFRDAIPVYTFERYRGSFRRFGFPSLAVESRGCPGLSGQILLKAKECGIPAVEISGTTCARYGISTEIDHATMVPLYYFGEAGVCLPMALVSLGILSFAQHYAFGACLQDAIAASGERVALVASGDLSHRLSPTAPAGYDPVGKEFDKQIIQFLTSGEPRSILEIDRTLVERAGECGFRPILSMLGALPEGKGGGNLISYEGPFGVGYAVVTFPRVGEN